MDDNTPNRLNADTTGSDFTPASYAIDPEDRELATRLANFDPLATPSPVQLTGTGAFKAPPRFTLSILSPDMQGPIAAQLAQVPANMRAEREHELVEKALKQNSVDLRIKVGPGAGATQVERERFLIAREVYDLETEEVSILQQLTEVEKMVPVFNEVTGEPVMDPKTGQQMMQPIDAVQGDRRKAMQARAAEIRRQVDLLNGFEGDRRLERALKATVDTEKAREQQLAEEREARSRADQINREERINAKADAYAKNRRHTL